MAVCHRCSFASVGGTNSFKAIEHRIDGPQGVLAFRHHFLMPNSVSRLLKRQTPGLFRAVSPVAMYIVHVQCILVLGHVTTVHPYNGCMYIY
jgi:hypothetical protein